MKRLRTVVVDFPAGRIKVSCDPLQCASEVTVSSLSSVTSWLSFMWWYTWMSGVKQKPAGFSRFHGNTPSVVPRGSGFSPFMFLSHTESIDLLIMSHKLFYQLCCTPLSSPLTYTGSKRMALSILGWHLHMDIFPTWASVWTSHSCSWIVIFFCITTEQNNVTPAQSAKRPSCKPWHLRYPLIDCVELLLTSIRSDHGSPESLHSSCSRISYFFNFLALPRHTNFPNES